MLCGKVDNIIVAAACQESLNLLKDGESPGSPEIKRLRIMLFKSALKPINILVDRANCITNDEHHAIVLSYIGDVVLQLGKIMLKQAYPLDYLAIHTLKRDGSAEYSTSLVVSLVLECCDVWIRPKKQYVLRYELRYENFTLTLFFL